MVKTRKKMKVQNVKMKICFFLYRLSNQQNQSILIESTCIHYIWFIDDKNTLSTPVWRTNFFYWTIDDKMRCSNCNQIKINIKQTNINGFHLHALRLLIYVRLTHTHTHTRFSILIRDQIVILIFILYKIFQHFEANGK